MTLDPTPRHAIWDRFIDALDRAGQAGSAADVMVPGLAVEGLAERRFGDLTRDDVKALVRFASALGRRGDVVQVLWEDMHRKLKKEKKDQKRKPGT